MSGSRATVGGGLGNNATGHGQSDINDDLLGVQVVLPNGQILETGSRTTSIDALVVRNDGPDLTGLFVRDAEFQHERAQQLLCADCAAGECSSDERQRWHPDVRAEGQDGHRGTQCDQRQPLNAARFARRDGHFGIPR
jgi:FAD/FMN-containing dehydrogenase